MGSRREDEKNELTIRRLLKLPENKRCINCNSLGPQYVCTNFSTFVCTPCSGIHREFSHRIKSVSMAKFTGAEVAALQAGGNGKAKEIFFRGLDTARVNLPDSGSPDRLRDFIKRVYEKRLYTGDKPPSAQQEEAAVELPQVRRLPEPAKVERPSDLRSLSFDDHVGGKDQINRRKSDFDRSSVGNRGSPKTLGSPQAPPRPTRHSYDDRDERVDPQLQQQQSPKPNGREKRVLSRPFSFKDFDNNPPPVQSIADILGDVPGLRVEIFKGDSANSSARSSVDGRKSTLSSQSFGAVGDVAAPAAVDYKRADSMSLIDINGDMGPPVVSAAVMEDPFAETSHVAPPASDSWATFNASPSPVVPPGYPAPKPAETNQWADAGWGQPQPQQQTSNLDSWSSFGTPSPPKVVAQPDPLTSIAPGVPQSVSNPGQPPRQRRELPQNFFAPSLDDHLPNVDMHRNQQMQPVFRPPQLNSPLDAYYNMGGFPGNLQHSAPAQDQNPVQFHPQMPLQSLEPSHQMSLQPGTPTQRSRNPFDDDFDDDSSASLASSATTGMQFPSMDALHSALPPTMPMSSGFSGMESAPAPTNAAPSDWGYSFSQFSETTSHAGSFNFSSAQTASSFQMAPFPTQPNAPGAYMTTHPFGQEAPFQGNQFHTHNVVRPAGGNPFG